MSGWRKMLRWFRPLYSRGLTMDDEPEAAPATRSGRRSFTCAARSAGRGAVFAARFAMNDRCPVCGLLFMREPGYFTGAMYVSYALGIPIVALLTLVAYLLVPDLAALSTGLAGLGGALAACAGGLSLFAGALDPLSTRSIDSSIIRDCRTHRWVSTVLSPRIRRPRPRHRHATGLKGSPDDARQSR